jgi:hypothetical protein
VDPVPKCRRDVPTVSAVQVTQVAAMTGSRVYQETLFPQAEVFAIPDRDATGAGSRRRLRSAAAVLSPSAQRSITQHRRCMYSFCRRLPPCPAGTQCQCGSAVNVAASSHEWHAMLNEEMPAVVQCDIKQNKSECPARCREAISF